jgi:hypothetical protein
MHEFFTPALYGCGEFTPWRLYPRRKSFRHQFPARLGRFKLRSACTGSEETNFVPLRVIKPIFLVLPNNHPVSIPTKLFRLLVTITVRDSTAVLNRWAASLWDVRCQAFKRIMFI